jgi:hypothetical protein
MTSTHVPQTRTAGGASPEERGESRAGTAHNGQRGALHMHTAHANVPIPYFTPGDLGANAKAATSKLPALTRLPGMPPPRRLAFYGGLGALVVTGLVDLPVAAAIGVATLVARGGRREEGLRPEQQPPERAAQEQPTEQAMPPGPPGQAV